LAVIFCSESTANNNLTQHFDVDYKP